MTLLLLLNGTAPTHPALISAWQVAFLRIRGNTHARVWLLLNNNIITEYCLVLTEQRPGSAREP